MNRHKILVCDDDTGILEVIKIILEENNYEVKTSSTGKGIQKAILSFAPDLIFLDIWMPGMDGKEVTKLLKKDTLTKNIPIIIISALNNTKDISEDIGANGFLPKPFTIENLLKIVEANLPK